MTSPAAPAAPASTPNDRAFLVRCYVLFAALELLLLAPVLNGGYFADDWQFRVTDPSAHILGAFQERHPYVFYRPLEWSLSALSQTLFGPTTVPVHVVNVLVHVALVVLVVRVLRVLGASRSIAVLGGLFACVSQVATGTVAGNDTLSQTIATAAGYAALYWMVPAPHRGGRPRAALAIGCYALALLGKEAATGFAPALLGLILWAGSRAEATERRSWLVRALCLVVLIAGYLALRRHVGAVNPNFEAGGHMQIGPNLLRNPLMLWSAVLVPVRTTLVFLGVVLHRFAWPAIAAVGTLLVTCTCLIGLHRIAARHWGRAALLLVAATSIAAPILLLRHVAQTNAYVLLPFAAVTYALGIRELLVRARPGWLRACAGLLATLVLVGQIHASRADARDMAVNGRIAAVAMDELLRAARALPPGGSLVLLEPTLPIPNYSVYQMRGFVLAPEDELRRLVPRPDITIERTAPGAPEPPPREGQVVYTMERGEQLVRLQ